MVISRAAKHDLPAIQYLLAKYGKMTITKDHLNNRDIAVQARDEGALVGFAWGGLFANNTIMYIDKVAVDPAYVGNGIVNKMYHFLVHLGIKAGVKQGFGHIKHDEYHDKACINALKMSFGSDNAPFTLVYADAENILKAMGK